GGHDHTFSVARALVFGVDPGPQVRPPLLLEGNNPRGGPPWSERERRPKWAEADTTPSRRARGWLRGGAPAGARRPAPAGRPPPRRDPEDEGPSGPAAVPQQRRTFSFGPLSLRPGRPRRTKSGKLLVPLAVLKDGREIDRLPLSDSLNGRREVAAALRACAGP